MKILLLAGEESGVLYADRLRRTPELASAEIRGYGDYGFATADLAVFGITAVLKRIFFFLRVKRVMCQAIREWRPDVVCTIDYPGMNLKLAAYAHTLGIRTVHVVCPQVWAWKAGRIPKIEAILDRLCCFFPFEPALFRPGLADWVGHPLVAEFAGKHAPEPRLVAALPGSRLGEIRRHLPILLESLSQLRDVYVEIPAANGRAEAEIKSILAQHPVQFPLRVTSGGAEALLLRAEVAVVASGTATLQAALARCPTVLVYRVEPILAWFLRRAITGVRHVGLANIIWEKAGGTGVAPMPELLQENFTAAAVTDYLAKWLDDPAAREEIRSRLSKAVRLLEKEGDPIRNIACDILGEGK